MFLNGFIKRANKIIFEYEEPIEYLKKRGIGKEYIQKFDLGYVRIANIKEVDSPDYRSLSERTFKFKTLQNKILFPIYNLIGNVHGICTRDIEDKRYKQYFLTEAKKIGAFFGLREALPYIRNTKKVFVHEGALDSISFSYVFKNSISSLTSFLNEAQFELLSFLCDKIIIIYDEDKAGAIGVYKTVKYYGDKIIDMVNIGMDDSNNYLSRLGEEKFVNYIRSKIPFSLQN